MALVVSKSIILLILVFGLNTSITHAFAGDNSLNVYKINLNLLDNYKVIKKGTLLDLVLLNDISTTKNEKRNLIDFEVLNNDNLNIKASGSISMLTNGERFSMHSSVGLSTAKLFLDDGQEINFSASSPEFQGAHPSRTGNSSLNSLGLARAITNLSIASSPATFGASLGISFLLGGLLSAHQNGISDFFWGGLDGTGLTFLEKIFRKQPELYLSSGTSLPFVLNQDLKISNGIKMEKFESVHLNKEEAISKIKQLIEWGDLTGALELSAKTGQEKIYNQILTVIARRL